MRVYDCFTFSNELDLLEIRLEAMDRAVDVFVIAEAPVTFQGNPKPLHFAANRDRFRRFLPRIRHLVIEDMPGGGSPWAREFHQRNALRRGLLDAAPGDTVMVSDADEVLRPAAIAEAIRRATFCFFAMDLHLYFLDREAGPWMKSYAAPAATIAGMPDLNAPRLHEALYLRELGLPEAEHVIPGAGWHFTWTGGIDRMLEKLRAFSHDEPAVARWQEDPAALLAEVQAGRFFADGRPLRPVALRSLPHAIRRRLGHFAARGLLSRPPSTLDRALGWSASIWAELGRRAPRG